MPSRKGNAKADIAAKLCMSLPTVKAHVSRRVKVGAEIRVQIALMVQEAAGSPPGRC